MPRPPRIDYPNAFYHVTSRGNGRSKIFFDNDDRNRVIRQLGDNLDKHAVVLHYGGISTSAVSNIRRTIRKGENDLLLAVHRLLKRIRQHDALRTPKV